MGRTVRELADSTYGQRETVIGPLPVTKVLSSGGLELDRTGLALSDMVHVVAEYSADAGKSWRLWAGFTTKGSTENDTARLMVEAMPPKDSNLRVRVWTDGTSVRQALRLVEVD